MTTWIDQWNMLKATFMTYGAKVADLEKLEFETKQALVMFYNHIKLDAATRGATRKEHK